MAGTTIQGTAGSDTLLGGTGVDRIIGLGGDDVLDARPAGTYLDGGYGDDTLIGGAGRQVFTGGPGHDTYRVGTLADLLGMTYIPGVGWWPSYASPDGIVMGPGDTLDLSGTGLAFVPVLSGPNQVVVDETSVTISYASGDGWTSARIVGPSFDRPPIPLSAGPAGSGLVIAASRRLSGTEAADLLTALQDDASLDGRGGDDTLVGGAGRTTFDGGTGTNLIRPGTGVETIDASQGANVIRYTSLAQMGDTIIGFGTDDVLDISALGLGWNPNGAWQSRIPGETRAHHLTVVAGLPGGGLPPVGASFLSAGGRDLLTFDAILPALSEEAPGMLRAIARAVRTGTEGGESLAGTQVADTLSGLGGNDTLTGLGGDDTLSGGPGDDLLLGGAGRDIALLSAARGAVTVTRQDGVATLHGPDGTDTLHGVEALLFAGESAPRGLAPVAADADADGLADLLRQGPDGAIAIAAGLGMAAERPELGRDAVLARGDLDGDGKGDLLTRAADGTVTLRLMDGARVALGVPGGGWQPLTLADMDGDGRADLLWRHDSGAIGIWLMAGLQPLATGALALQSEWALAGARDLTGDGKADLLLRGPGDALALWHGDGVGVSAMEMIGTLPAGWSLDGLADVNGDGKADLLLRDPTSGWTGAWLMDGARAIAWQAVAHLPGAVRLLGAEVNGDGLEDVLAELPGHAGTAFIMGPQGVVEARAVPGGLADAIL